LTHQIVPGGRHLWATGVQMGNSAINNCHGADHTGRFSEHFEHTFLRLMEGGGVGSNVSDKFINSRGGGPTTPGKPWRVRAHHEIHIICNPNHKDYERYVQLENEYDILCRGVAEAFIFRDAAGQFNLLRQNFLDETVFPFAGLLSKEYSYRSTPTESPNVRFLQVKDSREGWAEVLLEIMDAYVNDRHPKKFVIDVSQIRAFGEPIRTFGGTASGPEAFMLLLRRIEALMAERAGSDLGWHDIALIEHWIALAVISGGARRSARMLMKYWGDPGIFEFINMKRPLPSGHTPHGTTNISAVVDNKFFRRYKAGDHHAVKVAEAIVAGMLQNGEPGVVNASKFLEGEAPGTTFYVTNPCGEIGFVKYEDMYSFDVCCIGHINLAMLEEPELASRLLARFLLRASCAPIADPRMKANVERNHRLGGGLLGYADWLILNGIKYSESYKHPGVTTFLRELREMLVKNAKTYAHELRVVSPIKYTTIAPTGTVSMLSGVTSGLQPVFAKFFIRRVRFSEGKDPEQLEALRAQGYHIEADAQTANTSVVEFVTRSALFDRALQEFRERYPEDTPEQIEARVVEVFEDEADLTYKDVLNVQKMLQSVWADNAISVTTNLSQDLDPEELTKDLMRRAEKLKGLTLFPEASFPQAPLERI